MSKCDRISYIDPNEYFFVIFFLELNKEKLLDPFIHETNIGIQMYIDCEYFVKEFSTYWFG